jgi:hypothetical protein
LARKIVVQVLCDRCGEDVQSEDAVEFSVDGVAYRADLCPTHKADFTAALDPFVRSAERIEGRLRAAARRPARSSSSSRSADELSAIRSWAREQGYAVSDRGRIARDIQEAYERRESAG